MKRTILRVAPLAAIALLAAGCSDSSSPATKPANDSGTSTSTGHDAAPGGDAVAGGDAGGDKNPDGVPYPSAPSGGYGHTARVGTTPGSVIANFKFQGRVDSGPNLTTISLADYYDPCNKRYKILHLSVAAVWCEPCSEETTAVVTDLSSPGSILNKDKVVFVQALDEGATAGVPATVSDLSYWITSHSSSFTEMLDPGLANFGGFFNASAVPWNADIDVRTMEMLTSGTGWGGDLTTEVAPGLAALPATPSYPVPESAGCK